MLLKKIWVLVFSFMYLVLVDVKDRSIVLELLVGSGEQDIDFKRKKK